MNKLYWIVCEENDNTLYEGRFLGRTRGAALKHLKEQLGRSNLTGLVFAITEIPVTLIREIVTEIMAGNTAPAHVNGTRSTAPAEPESDDTEEVAPLPSETVTDTPSGHDWAAIKACYMEGRGPKDVAELMNVPLNTLKGRITREGWARERREA
jgi:hypothetical protein